MSPPGNGQTVRGGRAALDRLQDDLKALQEVAAQLDGLADRADKDFYRNLDLAKERFGDVRQMAQDMQTTLADLTRYVEGELTAILRRRDQAGAAESQALQDRLVRIEARLARVEERQAARDGELPPPPQ